MAIIRPFRAWRYNEERIRDINLKFSPLFDVVSADQLEALYQIPNNSIHISVPRSNGEALAKLEEWKKNGIIRQDPLPGIYIYYQQFSLFGDTREYTRKGFVSMIRLSGTEEEDNGGIVLHEDTITSSVHERSMHLEQTLMNVAPTHGLYEDPDKELEDLMDQYMETPLYQYIDYQGVINKLCIVQQKEDIEVFIKILNSKKVYLADGHHRLASSQALRKKWLSQNKELAEDSLLHYHLMYLTNLHADDLRILPIHRTLTLETPPESIDGLMDRFSPWFNVLDVSKNKAPIYAEVKGNPYRFGMIAGDRQFLLDLKPEIDPASFIPLDLPDSVKKLSYTVLHYFVFEKVFGILYQDQPKTDKIAYEKDYSTGVKKALKDPSILAFVMDGLDMESMMSVCRAGALMPQKSTYFYPKVVCGLVFASIDDTENNTPFDTCFKVSEAAATAP